MAAAILLFCFQGAGRAPKRSGDLVQRGRKNKVLRGFVHQVRAGRALKRSGDLVQRGRKNKALRGSVHQVRAGRASTPGRKIGKGGPGTAQVGAPLPAKTCIFVARRQHFALERSRQPVELAPHCRQSLVPPLRGANILLWSAARTPAKLAPVCRQNLMPPLQDANILPWPSSRPPKNNKKTSNLSCSSVVRDQGFEPWTP